MCPVSTRSIIHGVLRSCEGRRSLKCNNRLCAHTHSSSPPEVPLFFLSCLHVVLGCFREEEPSPPQAGLILFYGIDETG